MQQVMKSFSWIEAFRELRSTKCKPWDDRELDVLEAFKFISFALIQITGTSLFLTSAANFFGLTCPHDLLHVLPILGVDSLYE